MCGSMPVEMLSSFGRKRLGAKQIAKLDGNLTEDELDSEHTKGHTLSILYMEPRYARAHTHKEIEQYRTHTHIHKKLNNTSTHSHAHAHTTHKQKPNKTRAHTQTKHLRPPLTHTSLTSY